MMPEHLVCDQKLGLSGRACLVTVGTSLKCSWPLVLMYTVEIMAFIE